MRVIVSAATSADGYIDDGSGKRLVLSTPEDWKEVHRLRAECDAILVGANTIRMDNPSLVIKDDMLRSERSGRGQYPDIVKVTLTNSCNISPDARFFTTGQTGKIVFSSCTDNDFNGRAEIIHSDRITAAFIVTELEKRGIRKLLVEGGREVVRMFFDEGMVDTLRLAVNPAITVNDQDATPFGADPVAYAGGRCKVEKLGGMEVCTYEIRPDTTDKDMKYLRQAVEISRNSPPSATSYRVGAVVVTRRGEVFTGYTHESSPTKHAEQEAVIKAENAGAELVGGVIYSSMEPCSSRRSEHESCSELIIRQGFSRVVFALYEPDCFVECKGALNLRSAGITVNAITELAGEVEEINAHICG